MSAAALQAPKTTAAAPLRRRPAAPEILRPPGTAAPQPMGNQAALRTRSGGILQAKLTVNQPNDPYEQEADRIADQVMRMPDPTLQRKCACDGGCPKCKAAETHESPIRLQAKASGTPSPGHAEAPGIVHQVLQSPGQPLDPATRAFMEPRFGRDFGDVRIHEGDTAMESARAINARAYTVGNHVVLGAKQFAPESSGGQRLIAHELVHVVQQDGYSLARSMVQRAYNCLQWIEEDNKKIGALIDNALQKWNDNPENAWYDLVNQRRQTRNCCDKNLAAAEHYMYARWQVAAPSTQWNKWTMKLFIRLYGLLKATGYRLGLSAGECPMTPSSEAQVFWALKGADDGAKYPMAR